MTFSEISAWYSESAWVACRRQNAKARLSHKALNPPGTKLSKLRSTRYAEDYVLENLPPVADDEPRYARVFELGCGFASSMLYLANIEPHIQLAGICASDIELETARLVLRDDGKVQRVSVFKGDYEDPSNFRVFAAQDLVYAIEGLGELRDAGTFMTNMKKLIKTGAPLVIIDYWHTPSDGTEYQATRIAAESHSISRQAIIQAAEDAGFSCSYEADWSKWIAKDFSSNILGTLRDFFFLVFMPKSTQARLAAIERARATGLKRGRLFYGVMVFRAA